VIVPLGDSILAVVLELESVGPGFWVGVGVWLGFGVGVWFGSGVGVGVCATTAGRKDILKLNNAARKNTKSFILMGS
jgi:hypothetical protein